MKGKENPQGNGKEGKEKVKGNVNERDIGKKREKNTGKKNRKRERKRKTSSWSRRVKLTIAQSLYCFPFCEARSHYPGYQRFFSRVRPGASFCRPQADTCSAQGRTDTSGEATRKNLWRRAP